MSVHAILAPSSASRRMQCPGSRVMEATYPQAEDDPRALEGTLAHLVNQAVFGNKPLPNGHTEEICHEPEDDDGRCGCTNQNQK